MSHRSGKGMSSKASEDTILKVALDASLDAFGILSAVWEGGAIVDFRYEQLNEKACEYLQTPFERLKGRRALECFPIEAMRFHVGLLAEVMRTGKPCVARIAGAIRPDHWFEVRAVKVDDRHVAAVTRDVTDLVRQDAVLQAALDEARRQRDFADAVVGTIAGLVCVCDRA